MEKKPFIPGPRPRPAAPQRRGERPNTSKDLYTINERIRAREVRLVGDNVEPGIYTIQQAMHIADEQGLDLIEISPTANPPVCKVLDYQKFLYQQKKHQKEQKAKAQKVVVKEIRFGPQTDDHDYNFKLKHAIGFLQEGAKVYYAQRAPECGQHSRTVWCGFVADRMVDAYQRRRLQP